MKMHDVVQQGNESHMPESAVNMVCDIQDQHEVPSFGTNETPNSMETNLVSSPTEPQVQGNEELQGTTNTHRKLSTRLLQEEKGSHLEAPQVSITSVSSRGRNCKMSAVMQQSASQQHIYGQSFYISASSTLAEDSSPSDYDDGERHEREL